MAYDAAKSRVVSGAAIANFAGGTWTIAKETSLNLLLAALRVHGILKPSGTGTYDATKSRKYVAAPIANFDGAGTYAAGEQGALNTLIDALNAAGIVKPTGTGTYDATKSRNYLAAPVADLLAAYDATEEAKVNQILAACRLAGVIAS